MLQTMLYLLHLTELKFKHMILDQSTGDLLSHLLQQCWQAETMFGTAMAQDHLIFGRSRNGYIKISNI